MIRLAKPEDFVLDQVGIDGVQSAERLIQDDQVRVVQYRGYKLEFLAHALRQVFHFLVPPGFHLQFDEPFLDPGHGGLPGKSLELCQVHRLFADFHFLVQAAFFRHVPDTGNVRLRVKGAPVEQDLSFVGVENPGDHPQECRFARTVRTEQSEDRSFLDGETDIVHRFLRGKKLFEVAYFQDRCHACLGYGLGLWVSRDLQKFTNYGLKS